MIVDQTLPPRRVTETCPKCRGYGYSYSGDYCYPCNACDERGRITFDKFLGDSGTWEGTVEEAARRNLEGYNANVGMGCLIFLIMGIVFGTIIYFFGK